MTAADLKAVFAGAESGERFYWNCCDGHTRGTEFCWMPAAERWVYRDNDSGKAGQTCELVLVLSEADGDETGLNSLDGLLACDFESNRCLWVYGDDMPDDFFTPEDAQVYLLGDPSIGLVDTLDDEEAV